MDPEVVLVQVVAFFYPEPSAFAPLLHQVVIEVSTRTSKGPEKSNCANV